MYKKMFYITFLLLLCHVVSISAGTVPLAGNFCDSDREPLKIYGVTFPASVIYQNNRMYAPMELFFQYLGLKADMSRLPASLVVDGRNIPESLTGFGPDRNTGQSIYYIDVTGLLYFFNINYSMDGWKISVNKVITAVPSPTSGPVPPCRGSVTVVCSCKLDDMGLYRYDEVWTVYLTGQTNKEEDGRNSVTFSDLLPGTYRLREVHRCKLCNVTYPLYREYSAESTLEFQLKDGENKTVNMPNPAAIIDRTYRGDEIPKGVFPNGGP
ncbi:MAG: hypothetical protein ABRQ39_17680 [Candidatus Eremiobacterota bacterium]